MTKAEERLYARASNMAVVIMGKEYVRGTRGSPSTLVARATEDPCAWWCLTEALVGIAKKYARESAVSPDTSKSNKGE